MGIRTSSISSGVAGGSGGSGRLSASAMSCRQFGEFAVMYVLLAAGASKCRRRFQESTVTSVGRFHTRMRACQFMVVEVAASGVI